WETTYDGHIELVANPLELAGQVWQHLGRLGQALVDVPVHLAAGLVVVALAGLAVASVRGPVRAAARVLLALPVVAFAGSLVGLIPFGPLPFDVVFPGGRASLWLLPSLVLGLAAAVELALRAAAPHRRVVGAAVAALAVAAALVGAPDPVDYGVLG